MTPDSQQDAGAVAGPDYGAIYARRFPENDPVRARWRRALWQVLVDGFFSRWIPHEGTVLDFGCGQGEFINAVRARRRIAVDARPDLERHLATGVEFICTPDIRLPQIADGTVDVVFCSNLLEHLPDRKTVTMLLRECARVLRPGTGRLLVLGPNLRYTGASYWDFFDHVLPFTDRSLVEALATANFAPEKLIPRFLPYTTVGSPRVPVVLVRWYLRLPLCWRVLGGQFFAVARPRRW
jgi:SAM-dependent methyltransferase